MNTRLVESIYRPTVYSINDGLNRIGKLEFVKGKKKSYYANIPCAFDIETTNITKNDIKYAFMYIWQFCIDGIIIIGRTWGEFIDMSNRLVKLYGLNDDRHIIIYVHNLAFEFQFMRKYFKWKKIFSNDERQPIQAITESGIEFRCSMILSGYSLKKLGDELLTYKVEKAVGDLDYNLIRHTSTPLTTKEIHYCINDVLVVSAYIQERIEECGKISAIPLTKTGFAREYCRNMCLYKEAKRTSKSYRDNKYVNMIKILTLEPQVYSELKEAFAGGFTHASYLKSFKVWENVGSYDFTSSYPYVMLSEKFPMSRAFEVEPETLEQFEHYLKNYCCLFEIRLTNVLSVFDYEHYIATSKCRHIQQAILDNGRIVSALSLEMTVTELDFDIIKRCYTWDSIEVGNMKIFTKGYLPKNFIKAILKLYGDKTKLKGVKGKEAEYLSSKGILNSLFGMCVTDICRDEVIYKNEEWGKETPDIEKALTTYNKSAKRFLYYPWGVWVTAYARHNLWTGIFEFKDDYIYSDTDSLKVLNMSNHLDYINRYNKEVEQKLKVLAEYYNLDFDLFKPKTINGVEKIIGVWDYEGQYTRFKTLGAKRYMVEKDDEYSITVSGLNKSVTVPYLIKTYDDIFEAFNTGLHIPEYATGKLTHTYIDNEISGTIVDYLGNEDSFISPSSVHLGGAAYDFSVTQIYLDLVFGVKQNSLHIVG